MDGLTAERDHGNLLNNGNLSPSHGTTSTITNVFLYESGGSENFPSKVGDKWNADKSL